MKATIRPPAVRVQRCAAAAAGIQKNESSSGMPINGSGNSGQKLLSPVTNDSEIHQSDARNQPKPANPPIRAARRVLPVLAIQSAG